MNITEKRGSRRSAMFALIEKQQKSGQSQIQFCKDHEMSIATFSYWRKQYMVAHSSKEKEHSSPQEFIPVKIASPDKTAHPVEIILPNQIILRCAAWSTEDLPALVDRLQKVQS